MLALTASAAKGDTERCRAELIAQSKQSESAAPDEDVPYTSRAIVFQILARVTNFLTNRMTSSSASFLGYPDGGFLFEDGFHRENPSASRRARPRTGGFS